MPVAGILAGKGANIGNLFSTAPKVLKLHGRSFQNIYKIVSRRDSPGGHTLPMRVGVRPTPLPHGPPGLPPMALFCYMESFDEEKIISQLSGRGSAATRRNLGGSNLGLRWSCSAGENSPREGEIIIIVITNGPLIMNMNMLCE